jgi:hypothetical protein
MVLTSKERNSKMAIHPGIHQGKYGFYPCDWEVYHKLKVINMAFTKAISQKAAWERWDRKRPQNRVIRFKIKDAQGRVIGYENPIPMPEPEVCPIFCNKIVKKVQWDKQNNYHKDGIEETFMELSTLPIYEDYRRARYPVQAEEAVEFLSLSSQLIDELYRKVTAK